MPVGVNPVTNEPIPSQLPAGWYRDAQGRIHDSAGRVIDPKTGLPVGEVRGQQPPGTTREPTASAAGPAKGPNPGVATIPRGVQPRRGGTDAENAAWMVVNGQAADYATALAGITGSSGTGAAPAPGPARDPIGDYDPISPGVQSQPIGIHGRPGAVKMGPEDRYGPAMRLNTNQAGVQSNGDDDPWLIGAFEGGTYDPDVISRWYQRAASGDPAARDLLMKIGITGRDGESMESWAASRNLTTRDEAFAPGGKYYTAPGKPVPATPQAATANAAGGQDPRQMGPTGKSGGQVATESGLGVDGYDPYKPREDPYKRRVEPEDGPGSEYDTGRDVAGAVADQANAVLDQPIPDPIRRYIPEALNAGQQVAERARVVVPEAKKQVEHLFRGWR